MIDSGALESRIRALEDIEAIKVLKAKYWRCCDKKDWHGLAECFDANPVAEYGGPENQFTSVEAILKWVQDTAGRDSVSTIHQGHNPEIRLSGTNEADGVWEMYYYMHDRDSGFALTMGCFYEDTYVKQEGEWRIKSTKTIPVFIETEKKS